MVSSLGSLRIFRYFYPWSAAVAGVPWKLGSDFDLLRTAREQGGPCIEARGWVGAPYMKAPFAARRHCCPGESREYQDGSGSGQCRSGLV